MKKLALDFLRRGAVACGIGPVVLAVIYLILQPADLTATEVSVGIVSLAALAFVAGGMNALYQVERLPLMVAILIHGCVLYVGYLATYLLNGWLEQGILPILIFSGVFVAGYIVIWAIVYLIIKRKTNKLNQMLKKKQQERM